MQGRRHDLRPGRTWARFGILVVLAAIMPGSLATLPGSARAESIRTSALPPNIDDSDDADLPTLLAEADAERYRHIFALQAAGSWRAADREIAGLEDRLLLGTVEAQRYLHKAYHASYRELAAWLARHADEPDAKAIYALALKRRPAGAPAPPRPTVAMLVPHGGGGEASGSSKPMSADAAARWEAGLAAWRLGRYGEASSHFQEVARAAGQSSWAVAAAAFWAGRAELKRRHPERFTHWLDIAAEHPRTFYGLLARRTLGIDSTDDVDDPPFTAADAELLRATPAGRRALALLQVGERARAEAELRTLAPRGTPALVEALAALADRANMPALSLQLAGRVAGADGRTYDPALYPVPRWTPVGGFSVDRALLFALMRQESQFLPEVESAAGAVGLMQLMPATAHAMARRTGVTLARHDKRRTRNALAEPEVNLALAQEYITLLLDDDRIRGNLVLFAAAYNCGPAAALRWWSSRELRQDPLLFIESIPSQETRMFTERVLANYWIYRQRLGQPSPDLDALAAGEWPTYTALDSTTEPDRRHAENR
jgi:soluble lytic murein transglycosylase